MLQPKCSTVGFFLYIKRCKIATKKTLDICSCQRKVVYLHCNKLKTKEENDMNTTNGNTQSVYLDIPRSDWQLLKDLSKKFGWRAQTSEQRLEAFVNSRPQTTELTEEDIMNEVKAIRYSK